MPSFRVLAGLVLCAGVLSCVTIVASAAEIRPGAYSFGSEQSCAASGKIPAERCAIAAANARAEFEEKAPRFEARQTCERAFAAGCSIGFKGADGWAGKRSGVYFSPRQAGFRIIAASEREMTVTPFVLGPPIRFSARSILTRNVGIDPRAARSARESWRAGAAAIGGAKGSEGYGVDAPLAVGAREPLPPPPADPHFDCAELLEPQYKDQANSGCYLAPARHR
ncbi:MAG TPA: DUF1190 domain-containing protein [Methylocystis sp.]|nr:DUF1190 domain-containing protein [Methylocystis sp.]